MRGRNSIVSMNSEIEREAGGSLIGFICTRLKTRGLPDMCRLSLKRLDIEVKNR